MAPHLHQHVKPHMHAQSSAKQRQLSLLVVEGFAGTYSVAGQLQQAAADSWQGRSYKLAAWVGFELEKNYAAEAPTPQQLGLSPQHYLNLGLQGTSGDVTSAQLHDSLTQFVRKQLQAPTVVDAAVVLGGPPCTMYSCAAPDCNLFPEKAAADLAGTTCYEAEAKSKAAQQALATAIKQGVTGPALAVKQTAATKAEAARQAALAAVKPAEAAAAEEQQQYEAKLQSSDDMVESFIRLYKGIRAECEAAAKPCCLFMENPESTAQRGLWNTLFMKAKHLKQLPNTPAGRRRTFTPSKGAFLYPVRQTWCSYGAEQPQKRTIIFTDALGADGLPTLAELTCPKHCQVQPNSSGQRKHVTIKNMHSSKNRAAWAPGYVRAALEAGTASARHQLQLQQHAKRHKKHVDVVVHKAPEPAPEKQPQLLPAPSNETEELVRSVVAAVAACVAAAGQGGGKAAVATCKEQLRSSIVLLRKHLDYGRRYGRAKAACCYSKGVLLTMLQLLMGMNAKAAPLDPAIGLLKDLAVGLSLGKSTAQQLKDAGVAAAAGLGMPGRAQQLKELAKQESKTSAQRAVAAQALLLSVLAA